MAVKYYGLKEFPIPSTYLIENQFLGCMIDNQPFLADARKMITADNFADEANKAVWNKIVELDDAGQKIETSTLITKVDIQHFTNNILCHCKGLEAMSEIYDKIDALWTASMKRKAYFQATQMLQLASGTGSVEEIARLTGDYSQSVATAVHTENIVSVKDAVNEFAEILEHRERLLKEGKALRVPTSFPALDFVTFGGFARGNLVILAARPSVGKTAIMLQMARTASMLNTPALVFSLEMTNAELVQRMTTASGNLAPYKLAKGDIDWNAFDEATSKFVSLPLYFDDTCGTLDEIISKITTAVKQGKCGVVYIDYLGLISFRDGNKSPYQQVTEATKRLKRLAKDCGIPIVLLCQLNRDMSKEGREPQLHDLRDSGSIEQDADIVLMLDRQITDDFQIGHNVRMFIRKNRQGQAGGMLLLEADEFFTNFKQISTN